MPFIFQVIGKHNSGKTTLIEFLAKELKNKGFKVGYIKHDPKGKGITDKIASDTYRIKPYTKKTVLLSPNIVTLWITEGISLKETLKFFEDCDIVIIEGFKYEKNFPKVLVGEEDFIENFQNLPIISEIVIKVKSKRDYPKVLNWILENFKNTK
jgi:molybdopterin-guanine dinucleotide biosynthesis protein B